MSFKTLINSNVTNAFSLVGDLATDVQFTNITVTGYDFGNQTVRFNNYMHLLPSKVL